MPKKPLRETLRENQRGLDYYAKMYGKEQTVHIDVKPKREIKNHSDKYELEASVIADISKLLAHHPQVLFACRSNSGAAYMMGRDGKEMPVTFNRIIRSPIAMRTPDFWGLHKDNFGVRLFAIECKRRNWTKPTDQREHEQAAFLQMVRDAGGVGIFATCAEDVMRVINVELTGAEGVRVE